MKSAFAFALLALLPFSGLRMVCVTTHELVERAAAGVDAAAADGDECARICKKHPTATSPAVPPSPVLRCLLVAAPTCAVLAWVTPAVMPASPVAPVAERVAPIGRAAATHYIPPSPIPHTPPPETHA